MFPSLPREETLRNNRGCLLPFPGKNTYLVNLIKTTFQMSDYPLNSVWGEVSNKNLFRSLVSIKKKMVGGFVRRWLLLLDTLEREFKRKLTFIFLISSGNSAGLFFPSSVVKWGCRGQRQWFMDMVLELDVLN